MSGPPRAAKPAAPPEPPRSPRRARPAPAVGIALHAVVACLLVAIFVETWLVAGLMQPVIVVSGSMAPALRGPHRRWTCGGCGQSFDCALESLPTGGRPAVCPFCQTPNDPDACVELAGDHVLVDRAAYAWRAPRRWEVVVLECPDNEHAWCVKRVAGLPGERVEIRDGDVWIDGHVARRTLTEVRQTAVLVHKANGSEGGRWRDASGGWQFEGDRFALRAKTAPGADGEPPIHWLAYHHPPRSANVNTGDEGPILDESPFDQTEPRLLNPVGDVLLACRVDCGSSGALFVRGNHHGRTFVGRLDFERRRATLERDGQLVASEPLTFVGGAPFQLEWMLADGQVKLAVDDRVVVEHADPPAGGPSDGLPALALGARGADVSLRGVAVFRDVNYTPGPRGREFVLAAGEYFLLGDNSPHSEDSRTWPRAGVSAAQLIGHARWW